MKNLLYILFLIITGLNIHAQTLKNVEYTFKVKGLTENDSCYLAYHLGSKQFIKDTLKPDKNGVMIFKDAEIHSGLYMLVSARNMTKIDILINEPKFTLETSFDSKFGDVKFIGSKENDIFHNYMDVISDSRKKINEIKSNNNLTEKEKDDKQETINKYVVDYQKKIISNNPDLFVSHFIKSNLAVKIDAIPENLTEEEIKSFRFYSYRKNFFNNIDYTKSYLLYTPIFENKIETYIEKLTVKNIDSLIYSCDYLLGLTEKNDELYKSTLIFLLNKFAKTKAVCQDKVYVYLVENYYKKGKAHWIDEEQLQKIYKSSDKLKKVLCGNKVSNFKLFDDQKKQVELYKVNAKFTVLIIGRFNNGNYKRELKRLKAINSLTDIDVKVITVSLEPSQDINDYYTKNGLNRFINLTSEINNEIISNYNHEHAYSIFLLDKDKNLMLKRIDANQVKEYLESTNKD